MSAPNRRVAPASTDGHEPQPTPDQDGLTGQVAAVILASGSIALVAAAILALLRRRGRRVSLPTVTAALALASARTKHEPRMVGRTDVARAQRSTEAFYRAAYVVNAAERLEAAVRFAVDTFDASPAADGDPSSVDDRRRQIGKDALRVATGRERSYEKAHERARKARMAAAVAVADAADQYGDVLGWHAVNDGHETPECRLADGSNFQASRPPVIGWPGTLHGGTCRCRPGAPHDNAPSTDEATGMAGPWSA